MLLTDVTLRIRIQSYVVVRSGEDQDVTIWISVSLYDVALQITLTVWTYSHGQWRDAGSTPAAFIH